jgi:type II secretory pathway pseudopilin PulG
MLEVVLSMVLLALVTSMIMTAIASMMAAQTTHRQRLAAAEVANRLTLQYLDDKKTLPASGSTILYGRDKYRWDLAERPVTITPARPESVQNRGNSGLSLNRLKSVSFRVWLGEESGGSHGFDTTYPSFVISRLVDPIALRNPDSIDYMLKNPEAYQEFLKNFTGGAGSSGANPPGGGPTGKNPPVGKGKDSGRPSPMSGGRP